MYRVVLAPENFVSFGDDLMVKEFNGVVEIYEQGSYTYFEDGEDEIIAMFPTSRILSITAQGCQEGRDVIDAEAL
jgi:hypothetical protein